MRLFLAILALPLFAALFIVDLMPGSGAWHREHPHTQNMGPIRLLLHNRICKLLDEMEAAVERRS